MGVPCSFSSAVGSSASSFIIFPSRSILRVFFDTFGGFFFWVFVFFPGAPRRENTMRARAGQGAGRGQLMMAGHGPPNPNPPNKYTMDETKRMHKQHHHHTGPEALLQTVSSCSALRLRLSGHRFNGSMVLCPCLSLLLINNNKLLRGLYQ